jgi:transposase
MQGRHHAHPQLFAYTDIERLIPETHLLRKIRKVLDVSFVRELTKSYYCDDNGRPSIDPEVFFRMQVIAYLYGIISDRQLCEEIQVNLAYRWFIGLSLEDEVPDHSTLTRIRDRFGEEVFKEVFERVVQQCQKAGLVKGRKIIADATLIEADASLDSMVRREKGDPDFRELKNHEKQYHDFKMGKKKRKVLNQTHVSSTDPHSSLVSYRSWHRKLLL